LSNLYDNITNLCIRKGVKPSRMCVDLGIPKSFMTELKKGKTKSCREDKAQLISKYFGVSVPDLLYGRVSVIPADTSTLTEPLTVEYDVTPSGKQRREQMERLAEKMHHGVKIPVYGQIAAGVPIEAIEDIIDYEEIPAEMAKDGEYIALMIKGDSMEPRLQTGDVVIIRKQETVDSGQIAAVMINGNEATLKKVILRTGGITLVPLNPKYEPMVYSNEQVKNLPIIIIGRVVEARCKL